MLGINKPVENPKLINAMDKLRKNPDAELENQFITALKEATLLIPVLKNNKLENQQGQVELSKDLNLDIQD